jgi:xanthine dehydrogenase YagS FAD-binding subunit
MRPFKYSEPESAKAAIKLVATDPNATYLAGGTNIIDLMKEDVARPDQLIDIGTLNLSQIKSITQGANKGGLSLGSLDKNTATANHPLVRSNYPLLTQAILAGASVQIRNMATNGGNLVQRTRCPYFYDVAMPCNKRMPGTGCGAMEGINRMHAIFGWSDKCIAVYPSDMAVALAVLDGVVKIEGLNGQQRSISMTDFHRLPGDTPEKDNNLAHGELITSVELPPNGMANNSYYLKVRDRSSYAFALLSVGAGLQLDGNKIVKANIAMGGVAHKPWRALTAEKMLIGKTATENNFKAAAEAEMDLARPLKYNKFKVELGKKAITRTLIMATNNDGNK